MANDDDAVEHTNPAPAEVFLDYEFAERLTALVNEFRRRGLSVDVIDAIMEHYGD